MIEYSATVCTYGLEALIVTSSYTKLPIRCSGGPIPIKHTLHINNEISDSPHLLGTFGDLGHKDTTVDLTPRKPSRLDLVWKLSQPKAATCASSARNLHCWGLLGRRVWKIFSRRQTPSRVQKRTHVLGLQDMSLGTRHQRAGA
jgi:hypothetical protein